MQKIAYHLLQDIVKDLLSKIKENFISHLSVISSEDLFFTFSFYKKEKLLISLNHHQPFISLIETKENFPTLINNMNDVLRKEIAGAYIRDITLKENDRIITFLLQKKNDYFEKVTYYLVIELIPHRANLLLLDEKMVILYASHYNGLNSSRPVVKGMKYEELPPLDKTNEDTYDFSLFKEEAKKYLEDAKQKRHKDKYDHLFTHVKSKIKSLNKKIVLLEDAIVKAKEDLSYKEMGELCYTIINDPSLLDEYLKEGLLKDYDKSLSIQDNASRYFKKYKKAKSTILHNEEEIEKSKKEIEYYQRIHFQLENGNDEDLEEINDLLKPQKGKKENRIRKGKKTKVSPYFVMYHDTKIGYGKTDEQNNILTFEKAKPNYLYFHIANYSGSHVVILKDNPSDEEKLIASEIALILSKKSDGDIYYTLVKNVKKGDYLGEVHLKSHQSYHLNHVRKSTKELLLTSKKMN
ncbi:MAG: NFACT family protein [Bacilli bacterium]|nr:NFACT family protein [Bacilli bacterium]